MELQRYWLIIRRRWWLVAAVPALVLLISLITYQRPAPMYRASMRFAIGIEGEEPVGAVSGEGRSDAWLASEYLADDLSEVLKGGSFSARIGERVGFPVRPGSIFASREHRIVSVSIDGYDPAEVQAIAEAVGAELEDAGAAYFPQLAGVRAKAILIDGPAIGQIGSSLREKLDLPIRLLLALVAGVALAFLWDYLDDTVRDQTELESLGVPILAKIPRSSRALRQAKRR
jgi:capsular polysaccharide biosynthesis protein